MKGKKLQKSLATIPLKRAFELMSMQFSPLVFSEQSKLHSKTGDFGLKISETWRRYPPFGYLRVHTYELLDIGSGNVSIPISICKETLYKKRIGK